MLENGFAPDVPPAAEAEAASAVPSASASPRAQDLRALPWSSIDNDTSKDLDQLEVAETLGNGDVRVRVAIADVDGMVPRGSATDQFAALNSTSVYTGVVTFHMLPDRFSTDLTSLRQDVDRASVVTEYVVTRDGETHSHAVYLARVENHAKLTYHEVGAWLEGTGGPPGAATRLIQEQVRLQDAVAQTLRANRAREGALDLDTIEAESVVQADDSVEIRLAAKTRANNLIEDFMIAANVAIARFLDGHGSPSIRRVVRTPARWERIVVLAQTLGGALPAQPDSGALEQFLQERRRVDPERFPDLSLAVVKLLGPGEYMLHEPGADDPGHFGLATNDYTHSTAPNRRYADLVSERLLKATVAGAPAPYQSEELDAIARHCTEREDAARKVERQVRKVTAAVSMASRVGQTFDAIVTGASPKGTYVRLLAPPVEGRVMRGEEGLDVGDRVRVQLIRTEPAHGFVDFARA